MDISVIIVNWNTKKLLEDCLTSIYKHTKTRSFSGEPDQDDEGGEKGLTFEVIVVDNGSEDGSQTMVKKEYPQVNLILNKDNLGFTKANNQGIKVTKGEYVLLLNSDTYLVENSLKKLVDLAKSMKNLGALGPLLLNEDRTIQQSAGFFPHLPQVFYWMSFIDDLPGGTILKPYHVDHNSFYQKNHQVDWVTAAAILVPKKVIANIGGLDEGIFMYGEEVDWCYRIKKAGYKVYFSPTTSIVHIGRGSSGKISQNAILGEYKGLVYFYKKHKSFLALQMVRAFLKIGALARMVVFPLFGKAKLAKFYAQSLKVV